MDGLIYLDNNATTRPLDEVVEAMLPFLRDEYANPSSVHRFGQQVRHKIELAREQVAGLINASPREIVFTSCGTESINHAIRGTLKSRGKRHLITSAVEHSAVRTLVKQLRAEGIEVDEIGVDHGGRLNTAELETALREETGLVSLMWANNETGVMFDVARIAALCKERNTPLHIDAVQAVGKVDIDVATLPVTLLSLSAHKFHGTKGVGALFIRRRTRVAPIIVGGGQERGTRAGTENVAGIIGMGVAAEIASRRSDEDRRRIGELRDRLESGILDAIPDARVNGCREHRVDTTTNIGFKRLQAEAILILLSEAGVCASSGAACSSGSLEPSHVLEAMGVEQAFAHGSVRFSLSRFTTREEVDHVVELLPPLLARLRTTMRV
jgi:cysteine desulfurase